MADLEALRLIRDSAASIAPRGDLRRLRALRWTDLGYDPAVLRQMGEMGWIGLRVPEADGGAGLGMAELCVVAEEIGAALAPEPLLPCAISAMLHPDPAVLAGEAVVPLAWQERADAIGAPPEATFASGKVAGRKLFVPAAGASAFLVTTSAGLVRVERDAPGLTVDMARLQDGGHTATVTLDAAPATAVPGDPADTLEDATLATAAMLLGVMEQAFAITLDFLRTRQQFGKPIGSFQALQHKAADLKLQVELTRASVEAAAATVDSGAAHWRCAAGGGVPGEGAGHGGDGGDPAGGAVARRGGLHGRIRRRAVSAPGDGAGNQYGSAAAHRARFARLMPDDED